LTFNGPLVSSFPVNQKRLKIGIIFGGISEQKVGMDHYAHQLLTIMKDLAPHHRYVLIDHRQTTNPFREQFEQLVLPLPRPPIRVSRWNLLVVPRVLDQFDLIFSPGLYGPLRIPRQTASVMVVHDLTRYLFPQFFSFNPVQKILDRLAYPAMVKRYDHIVAVSDATRRDLMARFNLPGEKISVIYHGADNSFHPVENRSLLEEFRKTRRLNKTFLLFLGTLEPRKNIPNLLKAYAGIKDRLPHDLILVGQKGWKWEPIFQAIEALHLKDRVRWIGYVEDKERVLFYQAAAALVYPSWYEGFGLPILEAMQSGCPVIASNLSAIPEVVGKAGLLVDPGSPEQLGQAILRLVEEPSLASQLSQLGLEQAKQFSWEKAARETLRVFEQAMEKRV
jgi:glycosyltransferase involved in cell wall biosynthesis